MKEKMHGTTTSSEDELWRSAFKRLGLWAIKKHGVSQGEAEELVGEAFVQFLTAGGALDPADYGGFLKAIGSRINGIAINRRRKKALHAVGLTDDGSPAEPQDPPDPEQSFLDREIARKAITTVLERVSGDDLVHSIILCMIDGIEDPAAQARALQIEVREVYNARRRLKSHIESIKNLMETW